MALNDSELEAAVKLMTTTIEHGNVTLLFTKNANPQTDFQFESLWERIVAAITSARTK